MGNKNTRVKDPVVNVEDRICTDIELPQIEVDQYIGKRVKVASFETRQGKNGVYVILKTEPVAVLDDIKDDDDKPLKLCATRLLGLLEDAEGKLGWNDKTKTGIYLHSKKVAHYKDLVGKEVVVQVRANDAGQKFLTFE